MGGIFDGGSKAQEQFSEWDRKKTVGPLQKRIDDIGNTFNLSAIQEAFRPAADGKTMDLQAIQALQGLNPQSFLQGSQGFLGSAQGAFADAAGKVGSDPLGATNFFQRALDPNFADPTKNAQVQGVMDAIVNQGQRGFNIGADKIAGAANAASGGVGQGSAKTDALSRLGADISAQVADQSANVLLGEGARLQGVQQSAAQQALGEGNRQAEILAMLGQGMGGLGANLGNLGIDATQAQAGGLANLGQKFSSQELQGALFPLMQQFDMAQLLKSGSMPTKSGYDKGSQVAGDAAKVIGAAALAFSDERVKHEISRADNEIDTFMKGLHPYEYKYKFEQDQVRYGIMAQDLEKSKIGKSLIKENSEGLKMVDINSAVLAIMATLSRIDSRLSKLEGSHGN